MSSFTDTPSAVIGFEFDGRGFDTVNAKLNQSLQGFERIEQSAGRLAGHMSTIGRSVTALAAGVSIGAVLGDFLKLEDLASRASINSGQIGGASSYGPYRDAFRDAGLATRVDARDLAGAALGITGQVGMAGMSSPNQWGYLGKSLGTFSRATGVDMGTLGATAGNLDLYQKLKAPDTGVLLATLFAQATAAGKGGQVPQWLSAVGGATTMLGQAHPMMTGPGTSKSMGALYGAVGAGNPIFQDPGMFQQGVAGIDQTLTNAYQNPRLQASLQMAGVGYWQQRGGLSGKGGVGMAKKVLSYSERQYGKGTIEQDLFLRSQFGDVSTDMLYAFSKGQATYDQLQGTDPSGSTYEGLQRRSESDQDTPSGRLDHTKQSLADLIDGPLEAILTFLGVDTPTEALALLGTGAIAKKLGAKLTKRLFNRLKTAAGKKVAQQAATAGAGAAGATADAAAEGIAGKAAKFGRFGLKGGVITTVAGILLDPGNLGNEDQLRLSRMTGQLRKKFGDGWASNQDAREWAVKQFNLHGRQGDIEKDIGQMFDQGGTQLTASAAAAAQLRAADHLEKAAKHLMDISPTTGQPTYKPSAYSGQNDPAGAGGTVASQLGANMILARSIAPVGSGGTSLSNTQLASFAGGDGGGGGTANTSGGGSGGGGSWSSCTLTWYDPALGGTNSSHGQADPHSKMADGAPYSASALTCAAPPAYEFGTKIEFKLGNKTVTCTVTDRGGDITGAHFDLSRGAASKIGLINAGKATGKFRVASRGNSKSTSKSNATMSSANAGSGGADAKWLAGGADSAAATAARLGTGGGLAVHVHVDGREVERTRRLVRG